MILEIEKVIFENESGGMDLLGFQTAFENKFTDKIMPGITVLTRDVRYYGFICWAINNNLNPVSDFERFFDKEQRLAFRLAQIYKDNKNVSYLGIRKASKNYKPPYYKTSIWAQYKNSMKNLGLLQNSNKLELTEQGLKMARLFKKANYDKNRIKDNNIAGVKKFFSNLLFEGNDEASKTRKKFKRDLLRAIKNEDFYKSLESRSSKRILIYASITTQIIKHLTDVLIDFHKEVKKQNKRGVEVRTSLNKPKIAGALFRARTLAKKLKNKELEIKGLKNLVEGDGDEILRGIIKRHIEVKEFPLLEQKSNKYFITKNRPPENAGIFGFRHGALESLLRSMDRMEKKV